MKIKIILSFFAIFFLTSNCGFKVLDKSKNNNFSIKEIRTSGEIRINYKIKNNLLVNSKKTSENQIVITLNTKKNKSIKEKNIKNEITKYQISLVSQLELFLIKGDTRTNFSKSVVGDYTASDSYSTTINNEKKIVEDLVENLSEKILDEISLRLNDL
tara:strand:+ start:643 stop:1116 length:474 start_codon:yes stop_codon:yes gene_type:complete